MEVSIPFKRERGYKVDHYKNTGEMPKGFQFPSNGNADRKHNLAPLAAMVADLFQFPSNGNADRKENNTPIALTPKI